MNPPDTNYAKTIDGVHIAYQVFGDGPVDLVYTAGQVSHVDRAWELPEAVSLFSRLASFSRVILFDSRGNGCSDRDLGVTFESGMDDVRAVMDAAGSDRALLFGYQDGGVLCALFAASFPDRASGLIMMHSMPRGLPAPDWEFGWTPEQWDENSALIDAGWGTPTFMREWLHWLSPKHPLDDATIARFGRFFRSAASPGSMIAMNEVLRDTDVRGILHTIQVPTLVLHSIDNQVEPIGEGRYTASQIPGAKLVELPFAEHMPYWEALDMVVENVERFAQQIRNDEVEFERVLATVLFTDIVDSTKQSAALGDRAWTEARSEHDQIVRANLSRFRGHEVKTMGDGFLATFDGPARGIRCAQAVAAAVRPLGIEIRGRFAYRGDRYSRATTSVDSASRSAPVSRRSLGRPRCWSRRR